MTTIRWAFRMYDKDGSGEIDVDEMVDIFSLMYSVQVLLVLLPMKLLVLIVQPQ